MKFPRLFKRKTIIVPTIPGILLITFVSVCVLATVVLPLHSFLSPINPVHGEMLIVEGWMPDYSLKKAVEEFSKNHCYKMIISTGVPLEKGSFLKEYHTYAEVGAATIHALGIGDSLIKPVPAPLSKRDRTFASAIAFKHWVDSTGANLHSFDICSLGPHARRSGLLFKSVFGPKYKIGIISIPDKDYSPRYWWKSSQGVRSVVDETVAYIYVRFFLLKQPF